MAKKNSAHSIPADPKDAIDVMKSVELKRNEDGQIIMSDEAYNAIVSCLEYAEAHIEELQRMVCEQLERRVVPAPRCWYYERTHGNCDACIIRKWCSIRKSYSGYTVTMPEEVERRNE